jgi:hypothetical protein
MNGLSELNPKRRFIRLFHSLRILLYTIQLEQNALSFFAINMHPYEMLKYVQMYVQNDPMRDE